MHKGRRICVCECGGIVRGVKEFDRWWTWCDTCSPVTVIIVKDSKIVTAKEE